LKTEIIFSITARVPNTRAKIAQALAVLEDAHSRCREQDVRQLQGVSAALEFLAQHANEQWPFEQFREALEDAGMDTTKPESRWQLLHASLNAIKRVIRR
jgi:hypothetical protein